MNTENERLCEFVECIVAVKERDALRVEVERLKAALLESREAHREATRERDAHHREETILRAEVERLRREYDVRAVIERCPAHDAPTLVDGYQRGRMRISCAECNDAENERLRGLIAQVEWVSGGYIMGPPSCPWCAYPVMEDGHTPDCPAFSARGEVRR